ncbi:class I SAM-dependent methyltransferase [Desulfovibrio ferrophilus]|uniref:Uncharacterized protein n=1 Tax=Desulfovibrio ferrophilus TaxID=241368 RepID=A0A2Z6B3H0_9BACT|nr:class I SAM-dependent methyltransferase [Desulfovibrio ferrophilus]BBD10003.1 uncharacterized protein DFE_3277 [Desulfovibrio ferrophilus]
MSYLAIDHHKNLSQLLPNQITTNIKPITQIKQAILDRDHSIPLRRDIKFLSRLNDIFAPVHAAQVKGRIPSKEHEAILSAAKRNLDLIEECTQTKMQGRSYLDIGCGWGYNIDEAHRRKARYSAGIEIGQVRHKSWEERVGDTDDMKFILDDLHTHDFQEQTFDIISSFNSFEHFDDPALILHRCSKIIAPQGLLLISFNPLFCAPMGSHKYRMINIPYVQNIFDDDIVSKYFFKKKVKDPYPGLNRKRVREFESILCEDEHFSPLVFNKHTDYRFAWMKGCFRNEFTDFSNDDLFISGITAVLKLK